jgi:hypothetical protein
MRSACLGRFSGSVVRTVGDWFDAGERIGDGPMMVVVLLGLGALVAVFAVTLDGTDAAAGVLLGEEDGED